MNDNTQEQDHRGYTQLPDAMPATRLTRIVTIKVSHHKKKAELGARILINKIFAPNSASARSLDIENVIEVKCYIDY